MCRLLAVLIALVPAVAFSQKFNRSGLRPGEPRERTEFATLAEWHAKFDEVRSKDGRDAIWVALSNFSRRKDLSPKERTAVRTVVLKIAEAAADDDEHTKLCTCNVLVSVGDKSAAGLVNKYLSDQSASVRSGAIRASHTSHDDDTVAALAGYIAMYGGGSRSIVQGSPIEALVSIGTKDARDVLQSIYDNKTHPDSDAAGKALDAMDAKVKRKRP